MASHRRPAPEGTDLRTHTPALQRRNTLRVTSKATYEGFSLGVQSHTARWSAQSWRTVQWQDCWHISMAVNMA